MVKYKLIHIVLVLLTCLFISCESNELEDVQMANDVEQLFSMNYKTINIPENRVYVNEERTIITRDNENQFSIVLIPDSQSYVDYRLQTTSKPPYPADQRLIYYRQMEYIKNNSYSNGGDFNLAIHLGDFVAHESTKNKEWKWADEATSILIDQIPFGCVPGNHDYFGATSRDSWKTVHIYGNSKYNKYFGPKSKYFKNKDWFGGATPNGMNQWSLFDLKGYKILFIGLEMEPSDRILEWAQKVIDSHPGIPTIVATHSYISIHNEAENPSQSAYITSYYRNYSEHNTPHQLWEKFVSMNNQIFMVLCGHSFGGNDFGEGLRIDTNDYGYPVYSILSDYQGRRHYLDWANIKHNLLPNEIQECGDGWLRILDFDMEKNKIHVSTYNPEFKMHEKDSRSDYELDISWEWGKR